MTSCGERLAARAYLQSRNRLVSCRSDGRRPDRLTQVANVGYACPGIPQSSTPWPSCIYLPRHQPQRTLYLPWLFSPGFPDFHFTFIFVVSSTTISFTCFTAYSCSQCLGISLHQYTCMVGFCRHFKSPHSFHRIISPHV